MVEVLEGRRLLSSTWFVAPNGNDNNNGSIALPFKTIQHAALLAEPGDTVYLRAGTYHEMVTPAHSGTSSAPITYSAYSNEVVTIDGADPITGWSATSSKTIFTASQYWNLGSGYNQVLVDDVEMNEASWPNTPVGAAHPVTSSVKSVTNAIIGTGWNYSETATIYDPSLPGGAGYWTGATIHIGMGQSWNIQTGTVVNSGSGWLTYVYQHETSYETPVAGNQFYLTGKQAALDSADEWYLNPSTGKLSLWTPKGDSPANHLVEAKHRQYAFDLNGLSYVNVRNISLIAATIETSSASSHDTISNISAKYISQQMVNPFPWNTNGFTTGIVLLGSNNILQNSTIFGSSGDGVYMAGTANTVQNCTISNVDYSGADEAGIEVLGTKNSILYNVIHDVGRDGILDSHSTLLQILHNTIYNIGKQLTTDLGAIYDYGTDSLGTVIAYNTLYNISAGGFGGDGIYCDAGSAHYIVHDNTISNTQIPIKLNPPNYSDTVYNNTIDGKVVAKTTSGGGTPGKSPATYKGSKGTLVTLGTLGGYKSAGAAINNSGNAVGTALLGVTGAAALYSGGKLSVVNPFGTSWGQALAENSAGQIVGSGFNTAGKQIAFLETSGKYQYLGDLPGDNTSIAYAINTSGQVAGVSYGDNAIGHAFLFTGGTLKALGTLGGSISQAFGINDAGTVVGSSTIAGDASVHAFSDSSGKMVDLGTLGGTSSYALAINKSGQIVGSSMTAKNAALHAFIYSGGVMKDIGTLPGYTNAVATGIDAAGDVVGYAYNGDTKPSHAFLYRAGKMIDLNSLIPTNTGWTLAQAAGINDKNQIVGTANNTDISSEAYVLSIVG